MAAVYLTLIALLVVGMHATHLPRTLAEPSRAVTRVSSVERVVALLSSGVALVVGRTPRRRRPRSVPHEREGDREQQQADDPEHEEQGARGLEVDSR